MTDPIRILLDIDPVTGKALLLTTDELSAWIASAARRYETQSTLKGLGIPLVEQQPAQPVTTEDSPAKTRSVASALSYNEAPKEASAKHLLLWGAMRIEALERAQRKATAADGGGS